MYPGIQNPNNNKRPLIDPFSGVKNPVQRRIIEEAERKGNSWIDSTTKDIKSGSTGGSSSQETDV